MLSMRKLLFALSTIIVLVPATILAFRESTRLAHPRHNVVPSFPTAHASRQQAVLAVKPQDPGRIFAAGAIGLSLEADELSTRDVDANNGSLNLLMRQLGPGVLRLGGSSLDYSWWTSNNEAPPTWAKSTITPADLVILRRLLIASNWRAILGVDLGHFEPHRAANEAATAEHILGSHLLGIEIGNEPNAYAISRQKLRPPSYDVNDYLDELNTYSVAIHAAAPQIGLYGPDVSSQTWLPTIASDPAIPFTAITQHYDPTTYSVPEATCKGTPVPTAGELLSTRVREQEDTTLAALVEAGDKAHRETRITETNTTASCDTDGGPATSPVFASALWSLDWSLRAASYGVAGLNFHGYVGRCGPNTVSPICASGYAAEARGQVTPQPEYYGLLAAKQLEGGSFLPVDITGPNSLAAVTAYATRRPNGNVILAIDNSGTTRFGDLRLSVPGYRRATSQSLAAPSLSATTDVTFGGASLASAQNVRRHSRSLRRRGEMFVLDVAPTSAYIVTLTPRS
jgi:hypothetical protein